MALDFIIKNNKEYPKDYLPIDIKTHNIIVTEAKKNVLLMFSRIADYYADSFYDVSELENLIKEIDMLMEKLSDSKDSINFLGELREMAMSALKQDTGIRVRAD